VEEGESQLEAHRVRPSFLLQTHNGHSHSFLAPSLETWHRDPSIGQNRQVLQLEGLIDTPLDAASMADPSSCSLLARLHSVPPSQFLPRLGRELSNHKPSSLLEYVITLGKIFLPRRSAVERSEQRATKVQAHTSASSPLLFFPQPSSAQARRSPHPEASTSLTLATARQPLRRSG
jgi:hypothetical protein